MKKKNKIKRTKTINKHFNKFDSARERKCHHFYEVIDNFISKAIKRRKFNFCLSNNLIYER